MRTLPSDYVTGASAPVRNLYTKLLLNDAEDTVFDMDSLISINIQRSMTDGSFGIGFTPSDRLSFSAVSSEKVPKDTRITQYLRFSASGSWERLGRFYCEECTRNGKIISVTAYDKMYRQTKKTVKFTGIPSKELAALTFPCTMQDMLDYIVKFRGLTCEFKCQPFTVQKLPMKNEKEYYTVRELFSFIASAHGCNARINSEGELQFKEFAAVESDFNASNVLDQQIDDSEPFTVTGILFKVGDSSIYIDDTEGSEYDEDDVGVVVCENPLATVEIAEYVWNKLGGLSYYGGTLKIRGTGIYECGDVISVANLKNPSDSTKYPICITGISYSISRSGFIEEITSAAAKQDGTSLSTSDSGTSSASEDYTAGVGIIIDTPDGHTKRIMLQRAFGSTIGGVAVSEQADFGVKMSGDIFLALKNPTSMQTGGIKLGDGLVPYLGFNPNTGFYRPSENCIVHLRLADGLKFIENNEEAEKGTLEYGENTYGGRAVSLNIGDGLEFDEETGAVKATGYGASFGIKILNGFISVKIGEDFEFAEDGSLVLKAGKGEDYTAGGGILISSDNEISVNVGKGLEIDGNGAVALKNDSGGSYSAGSGIEVSDENEISAKIGVGLEFGSDRAINALPNIESAVIISETNARYLLHEYTEVKYNAGNKIGYAGPSNQIVAQGYIFHNDFNLAPIYTAAIFDYGYCQYIKPVGVSKTTFEMRFKSTTATAQTFVLYGKNTDSTDEYSLLEFTTYDSEQTGMVFNWDKINSATADYPYGYVNGWVRVRFIASNGVVSYSSLIAVNIGFASEAEYNAAVGLTYEPVELTEVQETVTEV